MNKIRLIKTVIDKLPYAEDGSKPVIYWDIDLKGFGLRVGRQTKAFFVQRDINTKTYIRKIGSYGIFTPEEARNAAGAKQQPARGFPRRVFSCLKTGHSYIPERKIS